MGIIKNKFKILFVLIVVFSFFISACSDLNNVSNNSSNYKLSDDVSIRNFESEDEFKEFLQSSSGGEYYGDGMMRTASLSNDVQVTDSAMPEMAFDSVKLGDGEQSSNLDFSETNIQVEGVDELDIIKTDGDYIYTSSGNSVFIIEAYPASDASVVSTINLENSISGMFIEGDVLAVVGVVDDFDELQEFGFSSRISLTYVNLYDVSDRSNPEILKEYRFDGSYFNARLYDDVLYLSTNYNPFMRPEPLPIIIMDGVVSRLSSSDIFIYDSDYSSPSFVGIHSIDMLTQRKIDSKIITVDGSNHLYMSQDNIYLTFTERVNLYEIEQEIMLGEIMPHLSSKDREFIQRIKDVDADLMNKYEKQSKIMEVIYRYVEFLDSSEQEVLAEQVQKAVKDELRKLGYLENTLIHKINVHEGKFDFEAAGKVPGYIYGQFALDEYEGILRVASTIRQGTVVNDEYDGFDWQSRSPAMNNVYTLDGDMNIIGSLEGLAPTESIFSARYVGDRLYLVTFRQVDPFFVIDLSDPSNPVDLGELKITGYSRYLHPFDEDTIIGIGREGTESGRLLGLKISLFDVGDVSNPRELVTYVSDESTASSSAEWEHKAFLFSKEKELLVIPTQNRDWRNPENNYAGALVFKINKEEILARGIIDHEQGKNFWGGVERSLYIEDALFTKSANLLRINSLVSLESIKNLSLDSGKQGSLPRY
ncbi:MAG: beta-propeller domain-containing protein [Candidatus Woesearchaeota archaeon]